MHTGLQPCSPTATFSSVLPFNGLHPPNPCNYMHPCNYMDYYSFTDPKGMVGWVCLVGWPIADTLLIKWSHVNHRSGVDEGKSAVQRPLVHAMSKILCVCVCVCVCVYICYRLVVRWLLCPVRRCAVHRNHEFFDVISRYHQITFFRWVRHDKQLLLDVQTPGTKIRNIGRVRVCGGDCRISNRDIG